ncbi:RNA methyltransferase, TrmH family [Thermosyntropha lipolytica DSM 11003]|uniref:RNA methyltransferase, TrmH family n=1 Tax=Thermosyntropha lipolytica DSM 11003 TaxID=1123382 RepID=A0A1M5K4U8_9FIRM|nr:RNA methyltransferase [Thermosyntropha lipolytica]SHG47754.1 RNA methyltransferase, TrmH family [Thermosyntropha lipolytica DSM 11003]
MKVITSRENPRIKQAAGLKNKKNRSREGLFLIEGRKMIAEALDFSPPILQSIFIVDKLAPEYEAWAEKYPHLEWYVINEKLMQHICDTETPQGIAATAVLPAFTVEDLMAEDRLLILLDGVADPGNVGTIIRTAWAFEAGGVLLTKGSADPFSPKVVRSSMGGILHLPVVCGVEEEDLYKLKARGYIFMGTDARGDISYTDVDYKGRKVIVIGSEAHGISLTVKNLCRAFFTIPINPKADSLNAAIACAIILSRAAAARNA